MKKIKRFLASIILFIMFIPQVQPIVYGAIGNGTWIGGQYASGFKTTSTGSYGIIIRKLTEKGSGVKKTVFCMQHGVDFETGVWEYGSYYTPTTYELKLASKIAYFGWYINYRRLCCRWWNFR